MDKETKTEKYLREILEILKTREALEIVKGAAKKAVDLSVNKLTPGTSGGITSSCPHEYIKTCCGPTIGHTDPCSYYCARCGMQRGY